MARFKLSIILILTLKMILTHGAPPHRASHQSDIDSVVDFSSTVLPISNQDPLAKNKSSAVKENLEISQIEDSVNKNGEKIAEKRPDVVKNPNHLNAVPLERDGSLNQNYRREILVDNGVMENKVVVESTKDTDERLFEDIFKKIDANKDEKVSMDELVSYIQGNIVRHLEEAVAESQAVFKIVDADQNGYVTWEEYHSHFLVDKKVMSPEKAKNHIESEHEGIKPEDQEIMDKEILEWHRVDMNPQDSQLSPEEFLAFRHPELSKIALNDMVRDMFDRLDKASDDDRLTADEFVKIFDEVLPDDHQPDKFEERLTEFKNVDTNGDDFVDFQELLAFVDPANPRHARREAADLIEAADENGDNFLDAEEMKRNGHLFLHSSVLKAAEFMHDEF